MSSDQLGATVKTFTHRNPARLLLFLVPAFAVLFLLVVLGSPVASLRLKIGMGIVTAGSIAGYIWLRRRIGSSEIAAIHENGFRFKSRMVAWSEIADATHGRMGTLDILTLRFRKGAPIQIHGHIYGTDLTSDIAAGLRSREIEVFEQGS